MFFSLFALLHTWLWSSVNQLNRHWQIEGRRLIRWRGFMPALVLLPITILIPPPTDPLYWLATLTSAAMVTLHDGTMYDVSARFGAQVAFRLRPLILPAVFLVWLALKPSQFHALMEAPLMAGLIFLCLLGATFFLMRLSRCAISRAALVHMIPVIITGIVFEVTNKTAMDHGVFPSSTLYYVTTVSGAPFLFNMLRAGKHMPAQVRDMASIARQGAPLGLIVVSSMICKNIAMMHAPNPAYVTAITLTAPFWISLYLKVRGEKEEADWINGTGLVLTVIAMVLLSTQLPH